MRLVVRPDELLVIPPNLFPTDVLIPLLLIVTRTPGTIFFDLRNEKPIATLSVH